MIFGYKQRGREAEKACNVFFYLTYEGVIDIEAIEDDVQKKYVARNYTSCELTEIDVLFLIH